MVPPSAAPLIAVDPGHGGKDDGAAHDSVLEADINLALSRKLAENVVVMLPPGPGLRGVPSGGDDAARRPTAPPIHLIAGALAG